jgi:endonuclease G
MKPLSLALAIAAALTACSPAFDAPTTPARHAPASAAHDVLSSSPHLIIVELMADPSAVADASGEWVKLYNPGPVEVNLQSYRILSASGTNVYTGTGTVESHTIASAVNVPVGACVVLGNNTSSATNGGVSEAYSYGTAITLGNNNTDWITVKTPAGELLDSAAYSASTVNFAVTPPTRTIVAPSFTVQAGISRAVIDPSLDNSILAGTNWQSTPAGTTYGAGDRGTPNTCAYTYRFEDDVVVGPLDHVVINGPATVAAGASIQLNAVPQDASNVTVNGATVEWSSSDNAVASVDNTGRVTGVAASATPVTITATATKDATTRSATQQVMVTTPHIQWIDVSSSSTSFPPGFQTQLFATARVAQGGTIVNADFTFEALDPGIATITEVANTGIITGVSGSATRPRFRITAVPVGGGPAYEFTTQSITIEPPAPAPVTIYAKNDEFGRPTAASGAAPNDFLIVRPQLTLSYNQSRGTPNWVSYELDARQMVTGQDRCNCFTADPVLPSNKQILTSDYTTGGYDRGHMARSADRTAGNVDNATTFYLTNIVPQTADLNQGVWAQFENALADSARNGRAVYIITGPLYAQGHALTFLKNEGKVAVPDSTWKVAFIGPRTGEVPFTLANLQLWGDIAGTTLLAVSMPNVAGVRNDPWSKYVTTVDRIERSTGYDFLSLRPVAFQTALEAGDHSPVARFTVNGTRSEGAALVLDASISTDPDLGRTDLDRTEALTYVWGFSDGTTATGVSPTKTFANNGSYTATLTVSDAYGWQHAVTQTLTIANVGPQIASVAGASLFPGETYTATGAFTDPGADTWTATVNYGDGSGQQALALTGKTFQLGHQYTAAGTFTVTVSVNDGDATTQATATVIVIAPLDGVEMIVDAVDELEALSNGETAALEAKLHAASNQIRRNNGRAAANELNAFINQLQALVLSDRLTESAAAPLIDAARRLATSVSQSS